MGKDERVEDQIFPRDPRKSYGLVAVMDRSSPQADKGPEDTLFSFPVVLLWELVLLLGVTLAIFLFSLIKQAPLEEIANPQVTTDPAKAPWYFVGLQELLEHMHPTLAGVIIPGILVGFLIVLPYLDSSRQGVGRWFGSRRGLRITLLTALYAVIVMSASILLDNAFSLRELLREVAPQWIAQGLLPGAILALLVLLPVAVLLLGFNGSRSEVILVLFTMLAVAAFVYTLSGFLFRGPGFKLYLPWNMPGGYNPLDGL
jgi:quinol-cytochrome oxidoreductase complex cytochrome b subunit